VLVLTRRAGESIVIGDDVRVVVLDVRGDTVRLGIDAPRSVQVHRAEVYAEVQAANAAAATSADDLGTAADRLHRLARPVTARRPGSSPRGTAHGVQAPAVPAPAVPAPAVPAPAVPAPAVPAPEPQVPAEPRPRPKPGPPR
jgi:carbon storage regulator